MYVFVFLFRHFLTTFGSVFSVFQKTAKCEFLKHDKNKT